MDKYLDQLFLSQPYEYTLAHLIYQGASSYGDRAWCKIGSTAITFNQADIISNDIAAFLRYKGYHHGYDLFIPFDDGAEAYLVLLGALKAGVTVTNANTSLLTGHQFLNPMKRILTFEDKRFTAAGVSIKFEAIVNLGEQMLFFNIPATCKHTEAFCFYNDSSTGAASQTINQLDAVHSICSAADGRLLHPYLRMVYWWFKGLPADGASGAII